MLPKREDMLDSIGKPITQSLFLEIGYTSNSVYTLKEVDHEYEGRIYPSLKKLYLELEDTTEYEFANKYLLGWKHWQRIAENKALKPFVTEWREELELKLRSRAVKQMMELASGGSYQASKWLADRGWDTRGAGRPTKADKEKMSAIADKIDSEYSADILRLMPKQG